MTQFRQLARRLLDAASLPETDLNEVLGTLLEHLMAVTGSSAGGAIFVFEPVPHGRRIFSRALSPGLAKEVATDENLRARLERRVLGQRYRKQPKVERIGSRSNATRSIGRTGSILSVPLLDRKRVVGIAHLEAAKPSRHREHHVKQAQALANQAIPALRRSVVLERMSAAGLETGLIGSSPAFLELEEHLWRAGSSSRGHVLIRGERGSGKELAAWSIHAASDRWEAPFVPVLTPALAESLYVDELFGHERNAFTGAGSRRLGRFQAAEGGTLFLDEVGDLDSRVQATLLRVLETGEITPIGRDRPVNLDVRVVTATNRHLDQLTSSGRFRQDLLDRLAVFEIPVPPLRERVEDIPLLTNYFLRQYADELGRHLDRGCGVPCSNCSCRGRPECVSESLFEVFHEYPWPGNVRELKHTVLRLVASAAGETLDPVHLPRRFHDTRPSGELVEDDRNQETSLTLRAAIRRHILAVLRRNDFNQSRTAQALGLPLSTLRSKLKKLDIDVHEMRMSERSLEA